MNFNQHNITGIIVGAITAAWGYLTSGVLLTAQTIGDWSINQWAAAIGSIGVIVNIYFAWARHRREVIKQQYELGMREERRSRPTRREEQERRQ